MTLLTSPNLGTVLRNIIDTDFTVSKQAAHVLNTDPSALRSLIWRAERDRANCSKLAEYISKLGYEVHFTIIKKGTYNEAQDSQATASNKLIEASSTNGTTRKSRFTSTYL